MIGEDEGQKVKKSKKKKRKSGKQKIVRIGLICALLLIVFGIVLYSNNENFRNFMGTHIFNREVHENNLPEIAINRNTHVFAHNGRIITLEQNMLRAYNRAANEEFALSVRVTNPTFVSEGSFLVVAESGGNRIYLISGRNILWQKELEDEIDSVAVNRNGYVAVSMADATFSTVIETFNSEGARLFRTFLATSNVVDMAISNNNRYLAIAEANLSGIIIQSNIRIISIENAQESSTNAIIHTHMADVGDLIIRIKYDSRNNLICMYDGYIDSIRSGNENNRLAEFTSGTTLFADINLDSHIAKIVRESTGLFSNEVVLKIIDSNNTSRANRFELGGTPRSLDAAPNIIGVNLGTEVVFVNMNGWLVRRYHSVGEVQKIVMCDRIAGIVHRNRIEVISL